MKDWLDDEIAESVPPVLAAAVTESVPFDVGSKEPNAAVGTVNVPAPAEVGQVIFTIVVDEPFVTTLVSVISNTSNPLPVHVTVSGFARLIEVRLFQLVTVKLEGSVAEILNGPT